MAGPREPGRVGGTRLNLVIVACMFAGVIASVVVVNGRPGADPSGKDALPFVLGVVAVGMVAIVLNGTLAVRRARSADLRAAREEALRPPAPLADAGRASAEEVRRSLAVRADPEEALEARRAMWGFVGGVQRSASIAALLVVVLMIPAILTQDPRVIALAAIPIVLYALVAAVNTVRRGGTLDQGFAISDRVMAPLGLATVERPTWLVVPYATGGVHATVVGPTVLGGERHGRHVEIALNGGRCEVAVEAGVPAFEARGTKGVLAAPDDAPPAVRGVLAGLGPAPVWSGTRIEGGGGRILVARRRSGQDRWAHDLWLAERLAQAADPR
jgi:hypothetical protein